MRLLRSPLCHVASLLALFSATALGQQPPPSPEQLKEEAVLFTAPGFQRPGEAVWMGDYVATPMERWSRERTGQVEIVVRDADTGEPTHCRMNVVGHNGNFCQPPQNRLSRFALTAANHTLPGAWGNRLGTGPWRYTGRFFYSTGKTTVRVPSGAVRVEVWKGLEYRPETMSVEVAPDTVQRVEVKLTRAAPMAVAGYYSGDTHLHFMRENEEDDAVIFDLMNAEDLRYGAVLSWHLTGIYSAFMDRMMNPQRALGAASLRTRGDFHLISGQEYRNTAYGHLNFLLRDDLILAGRSIREEQWPAPGIMGRETIARGGFAFMAHGGHAKDIFAEVALGAISGVELLQHGSYRGIGLEGWYDMLSTGFRFAAHGASDYPPCRAMADNRTYVHFDAAREPRGADALVRGRPSGASPAVPGGAPGETDRERGIRATPTAPTMPEWLAGQTAGRSFFTTGPLLLLEVDGEKPGAQLRKSGAGPHSMRARVRVRSEVAPVTDLDLIVNGAVVKTVEFSREEGRGKWLELEQAISLGESSWIAARAHSRAPGGLPDAEAHTNPVYVCLNDRAPYQVAALDRWAAKIDAQMAVQAKRTFPEIALVLARFADAREVLLRIRAHSGMTADANPAKLVPVANIGGTAAQAHARLRTPHGISDRDVAVADAEVSDADMERSRSFARGDLKPLIAAAPALVDKKLARSREQYPTLETWQKRRAQLREEFLKAVELWPLPAKAPLNPIVHSRREYDGYSVENIAIESMPGFFCTGNLYSPLGATHSGPGVLCPHGHFQPSGRFREEHQIRCAHLARMGATVFSYSMVGWHDSRQTSHRDPLALALQTLNAIAAIDYLCSQPGVDPRKIGATGASGGGTQTLWSALIDERVVASCPVGIVYRWFAPLGCVCESGMPITQAAETNAIELAAAIAPRAQLFISLGGDGTRDFPETGFPFIRSIYELHGRADAVRNAHFAEEPHDFGPSKRKAMYEFFAQHLGMKPLPEDADTIAIERPRQMEVFNAAHPHPAHALQGSDAIGAAFKALPRTGLIPSR